MPLGSHVTPPGSDVPDTDALSINDLYLRIDRALRGALPGQVWVSGEVRSFNVSSRGHCYIDLVDHVNAQDNGSPVLKVVCWSGRWSRVRSTLDALGIALEAGLVVRVRGEVQLYKARGDISFILSELDTDSLLGKVAAERARLIKALVDEDLFDRNRRIEVPPLPLQVGLVASPGTEGHRDFIGQLEASGMAFVVRIAPTQVQGREAAVSVASAIRRLQTESCAVLVVVRGGGSKADLATFDAEAVARAISVSDMPVWTGIGHTGDQSVADEVANRSFITPTECGQELARLATDFWRTRMESGQAAGRLARGQLARSERSLDRQRRSTATCARSQVDRHTDRLVHRTHSVRTSVSGLLDSRSRNLAFRVRDLSKLSVRAVRTGQENVSLRARRLSSLPNRRLEVEDLRVAQWQRLVGAYDYQRQLERGYSVTRDDTGKVVRSAAELDRGSLMFTRLSDGEVVSTVTDTDTDIDREITRQDDAMISHQVTKHDEGTE